MSALFFAFFSVVVVKLLLRMSRNHRNFTESERCFKLHLKFEDYTEQELHNTWYEERIGEAYGKKVCGNTVKRSVGSGNAQWLRESR